MSLVKEKFEKPLFVTNCDVLINTDYSKAYLCHIESQNDITIVTALKNVVVPYGVIKFGIDGEVSQMEEKPKLSYFVNTGMYIINPNMMSLIPQDTFFHMTQLVEKIIAVGGKVGVFPISEDSFLDMGEFDEMKRMEEKLNIISDR